MNKLINIAFTLLFMPCLNAQQYISIEREREIKKSGNYYWAEGEHPKDENVAKSIAFTYLGDDIITDAVQQTIKNKEDLKELEMSVHFDRIEQEGVICILAWIEKDSVYVTTRRPIQPQPKSTYKKPDEQKKEVTIADPILQKLAK